MRRYLRMNEQLRRGAIRDAFLSHWMVSRRWAIRSNIRIIRNPITESGSSFSNARSNFLDGVKILGLQNDRIPALRELSASLEEATGWKVARIPGLLHERDFFGLLARRIFPSTDYIRGVEELDYTPAPDLFHDIFGHMPMLTDPDFADFYHRFGKAALNAAGQDRNSLERLHWFTVEFGLVDQAIGRRIYGAGILSSKEEVRHALSDEVTVHHFDSDRVTEQDYEVWHLQDVLFVVDSFAELESGFKEWTARRGLA